jgi:anti-sigma factor RsiW
MTLTCDEVRDLAAAFVLDALEPDEADAVRAHLATCADAHAEVAELGSIVPLLLEDVPLVEPPDRLKGRIMAAAAADLETRRGTPPVVVEATASAPVTTPSAFPTAAERETRAAARARPSMGTWALRIAAVLAIALLAGWNLLLQGQLGDARTYEQQVAAVLDVAGRPGSLTAVLTAEGGSGPAGLAAVSPDGDVRIAMRDLAPTSGTEVYEAWVIGGDGVPVALGSFPVGASGVAFFEGSGLPTEAGIVLALTREPAPGATAPSGAPVSAGTATSG